MIMILTGKTLNDFEMFLSEKYGSFKTTAFQECASAPEYEVFFDEITLPKSVKNALIIEFFDSVGIIIHTSYDIVDKKWGYEVFNSSKYDIYDESYDFDIPMIHNAFNNRQVATEQAIINANKIYNETKV